ncbi:single-stranded DNA-binding protein [Corynebacterium epidermidicanis]|uniref:Single-stranded DNA-binding protein n=1 Tax=Corynebacterium epidermidicanis TaxID=1050174 RepID=A0A0G3GUQ1_9CORY|nr:single-stranded DNA-binding protein [Corynebacterium epidermidicanis]AKK04230.1 single-strand binding protein [Corynebacterium epidermidicanis]
MAGETVITVVGNLVADPELRFTPAGAPVANFRIASTPRTLNRQTNQWEDGEALFLSCNVWRQAAENVAETLTKGMRVIVQGRLKQRSYETREGDKRTVFELEVDEIGPSLRYATAQVNRSQGGQGGGFNQGGYNQAGQGNQGGQAPRGGFGDQGGFGGQSGPAGGNQGARTQAAPVNDPWNSAPPAGGGFGGVDDEPPF